MLDATDHAKQIMKAVREINQMRNCNLTLVFLTDIFKGSDLKKIRESGMRYKLLPYTHIVSSCNMVYN